MKEPEKPQKQVKQSQGKKPTNTTTTATDTSILNTTTQPQAEPVQIETATKKSGKEMFVALRYIVLEQYENKSQLQLHLSLEIEQVIAMYI